MMTHSTVTSHRVPSRLTSKKATPASTTTSMVSKGPPPSAVFSEDPSKGLILRQVLEQLRGKDEYSLEYTKADQATAYCTL
jgi:hypothetical protein